MKVLDLGCGKNKYRCGDGDLVIGADLFALPGVDLVYDFARFPWPVESNQFDLVVCNHVLEHLEDIVSTMEELWRISKPGATIKIRSPYFSNYRAYTDPSHRHFFTAESFDYFDPTSRLAENWPFQTKATFRIINRELMFGRPFNVLAPLFNRILPIYEAFFAYLCPARQIYFELRTMKGE